MATDTRQGMEEAVVVLQKASTGRSKCRATGEPLQQGDWRVGWMGLAWLKPLEFLRSCWVEVCANPGRRSQGACKASKQPFQRGDVRLVTTAGEPTMRVYLSLPAAAEKLQPVLQLVGPDAFSPTDVAGLEDLPAADRAAFFEAFGVANSEAAEFEKEHPPPQAQPVVGRKRPALSAARSSAAAARRDVKPRKAVKRTRRSR
ncbi:hypothetical protein CHLNCDRAFT_56531 [Chlorella variabilis]|uniref:Uncharacterized protein n=1 Tax=Chlorella variabilis TaxID=554065 RepID=E1Z2U3_CHLVA|nr:hypothetical protein CHLNCDRAFT_56531 [Chlorella variabilis]EFN60055.1 hypothetical protein CHLNCDRAFT_56531 [Chlorella variabilis]|eukprot:XP_005852157.1 hypothetical protein CHLNCDRAFT_56531 [Chlorella variabilis]